MLIAAALIALVLANSPAAPAFTALLHYTPPLPLLHLQLHIWVNDGLMAIFFLLVGLELRREITSGELASLDRLAAPGFAAIGGMLLPALVFIAFNWTDPASLRGWAVPMATDIAFALAVLGVLRDRVPLGLKVFLTALAIIDDLGAILVIALFYSHGLDWIALAGVALAWLALWAMNRAGVRAVWPYLLGGILLWALVFRSGIHATLAGVALAFVIPMHRRNGETEAPAERLEHRLQAWTAYLVLPIFGLVNAGLSFDSLPPGVWTHRLSLGTMAALVLGKQLGVFGAVMAATRAGWARLPEGISAPQLYGASVLCGIGFTMSLFIGDLAFRGAENGDIVQLAVFAASLISAWWGLVVLWYVLPRPA